MLRGWNLDQVEVLLMIDNTGTTDEIYITDCGFKYCVRVNALILSIIQRSCKSIFLFLENTPEELKAKEHQMRASDSPMIRGGKN